MHFYYFEEYVFYKFGYVNNNFNKIMKNVRKMFGFDWPSMKLFKLLAECYCVGM